MERTDSWILVFSVIVFLTIIFVSATPTMIKTVLIILAIAFLLPFIRNILWKNNLRKIKVALYTSVVFTMWLSLSLILDGESIAYIFIIFFFSLIGNFLYGLPVSLLAEFLSIKFLDYRLIISGFIHIGFGFVPSIFELVLFTPAIICSIIFFALDEMTRKRFSTNTIR